MRRKLIKPLFLCIALLIAIGCKTVTQPRGIRRLFSFSSGAITSGGFTSEELSAFTALDPIDTHSHVRRVDLVFNALLDRLNVHLLDILLVDDRNPEESNLQVERNGAKAFINSAHGRAVLCTSIDPFKINDPGFAAMAIHDLDDDFANGAIAVKIWKNVGMEIKNAKGTYILPDDAGLDPIYRDIAAKNKTLIEHIADPDSAWAPPNKASPDYSYYAEHPEWYMYGKNNVPSKEMILAARDHILDRNPKLRFVGAHLGSMEANLPALADHFDRYPNFAVDMASRMPYFALLPRDKAIAFITRYQDRLIYATDLELHESDQVGARTRTWEETYAREWRFLATNDTVQFETVTARGLALPNSVLRKIYHDNALRWFPGIIPAH